MQIGLVFASGGALGAYDVGVLKRLYEHEPNFTPTLITGISMGALHASILASMLDDPVKIMETVWRQLARISFPLFSEHAESFLALLLNPHFYRFRQDFWMAPFWTNFYDPAPLRQIIETYVDFNQLNRSPTRIIIPVANIETGEIEYFENQGPHKTLITADHILAGCSLPPVFPMVEIDNKYYWDGGLFDPNPLFPIIERFAAFTDEDKRLIVMSLFPKQGDKPKNLFEVYLRMIGMIMANKIEAMMVSIYKHNDIAEWIETFDKKLPKTSQWKDLSEIKALLGHRFIREIIHIYNVDLGLTTGDLSWESLQHRMAAGYQDTAKAFQ